MVKKQWKEATPEIMRQLVVILEGSEDFSSASLEQLVKEWIQQQELSFGQVMAPLRLALVGDLKGPHLFDIMELLGKATVFRGSIKPFRVIANAFVEICNKLPQSPTYMLKSYYLDSLM